MKDPAARKSWALQVCLLAGMRLTPIRERIIAHLAAQRVPVSLEAMTQAGGIRGACNAATVYRTLMLLHELEVIRQVSLPNKASYFVLNVPGESTHFLACHRCGTICELPGLGSITDLEENIAAAEGYQRLYHELVFFGICPACQKHAPDVACAKVQARMKLHGGLKPHFVGRRDDRT